MMSDNSKSDSEEDLLDSRPVDNAKKIAVHKIVWKLNPAANNQSSDKFKYTTILDTGTEWTIVGGPGWLVTQIVNRTLNMSAVDQHMGDVRMNLCDAVTAVADESGNTQLIGVRRCGYSPTLNDDEAVLNMDLMREAGMKVNGCAKRHGGKQQVILSHGTPIALKYDATAYKMYMQCRAPTQDELRTIPVKWIDCHIEDLLIDDRKKPINLFKNTSSTVANVGILAIVSTTGAHSNCRNLVASVR